MAANAIVIICTALMVGAIIWVLMEERNVHDFDDDSNDDKTGKKDSEDKK